MFSIHKILLGKAVLALLGFATVAYPFIVYWGINHYQPFVFATLLFAILALRFVFSQQYLERSQWLVLITITLFCLIVLISNSSQLLRYYPALMSLSFALLFLYSLTSNMPIIEKFARMFGETPTPLRQSYTRNLTKVWISLLLFNASIATYSACCLPMHLWALYNGLLSYILFATFIGAEVLYRKYYFNKNTDTDLVQQSKNSE